MNDNIEATIAAILAGVDSKTQHLAENFTQAAKQDTAKFLEEVKGNLAEYSGQLARGEITQELLEWNVKGLVDLAVLHNLKEKELAEVEIDRFKQQMVNLITGVINAAISVAAKAK